MSAWNPIDGWVSSKPSKLEVLARVGPIKIDDYLIVSDNVRILTQIYWAVIICLFFIYLWLLFIKQLFNIKPIFL